MNLYRLDYVTGGGVPNRIGQQFLSRHMATARSFAVERAAETGKEVLISRIAAKNAAVRGVLIVRPDGTARKPPGAKGETCTAREGGPACFCRNCRAGRRA